MTAEVSTTKVSWWVRGPVLLLALLLVIMAAYRFWSVEPLARIDLGFLGLLALAIVLLLSEAFDTFSVGKILSVSREVKKKEREIEKLEQQNSNLLSQLVTVSTQQSQANTNVYGDYHAAGRVEKATAEEVEQSRENEDNSRSNAQGNEPAAPPRLRLDFRALDQFGMDRYCSLKGVEPTSVVRDAKLVSHFQDLDGISNSPLIFDGYIKEPEAETFVEVRPAGFVSSMWRDRIYVMLSKIQHYGQKNGRRVRLDLVVLKLPSRDDRPDNLVRILDEFRPAVANKLLSVSFVAVSEEEEANLMREES